VISWTDPRDQTGGVDEVVQLDDKQIVENLVALTKSRRHSLSDLSQDATTFWNAVLQFLKSDTVNETAWDCLLRSALEDPLGYLNGLGIRLPASIASAYSANVDHYIDGIPPSNYRSDQVCIYFMRNQCQRGDSCHFLHPTSDESLPQTQYTSRIVCRYYQTPGGCKFGDNCRYAHLPPQEVSYYPAPDEVPDKVEVDSDDDDPFLDETFGSKDYYIPCAQCGRIPTVSGTGLCGPCCFGTEDW